MKMKKLNFSCGNDIKKGWDNCDWQKTKRKDVLPCNANKFPYPFKDDTYDYILLKQCLNLFEKPRQVLEELHRISSNEAIIEIEVAYCNNKGAFTDLDTIHWFNEQTFLKYLESNCRIKKEEYFKLIELKLIPTIVGKFFPESLRNKLNLFIGGLISQIHLKLRVIK